MNVKLIRDLFNEMDGQQASDWQRGKVRAFRLAYPELDRALDFCFEVLAGKHKLGVTLYEVENTSVPSDTDLDPERVFHTITTLLREAGRTEEATRQICATLPRSLSNFYVRLFNRDYRLGYSNRERMRGALTPMLAKTYPKDLRGQHEFYVQEKLDGTRSIARMEHDGNWYHTSRNEKPQDLYFSDMHLLDEEYVYDGEVMTIGKMGVRDFSKTSGAVNSKFGDKSDLVFFIYDIVDATKAAYERQRILREMFKRIGPTTNVFRLPTINKVVLPGILAQEYLGKTMAKITSQGGEGLMLRAVAGRYEHKRSNHLLKYKQFQTADLRVVGWEYGEGKHTGVIGALLCESDCGEVKCKVGSGLTDDQRREFMSLKERTMIIEVQYFDRTRGQGNDYDSLRFPTFKRVRNDKTTTSLF